jgi:hypothetical protein
MVSKTTFEMKRNLKKPRLTRIRADKKSSDGRTVTTAP